MNYEPFREGDEPALGEILGTAFGFPPADVGEWFDRSGRENIRVLRDGALPVAVLVQIPMGQFFGGRSVPTIGVAGVGVALERRSEQLGKVLMQEHVRELAARGVPLSSLYPATQTLYRRAGYERAGKSSHVSVVLDHLDTGVRAEGLTARVLTEADMESVRAVYSEVARELDGHLDRGPYVWSRVVRPRGRSVRGYGFFDGDRLEAYAYLGQSRPDPLSYRMNIFATDICSLTPRGYSAIFGMIRAQRSVAKDLELRQAPNAPFLMLLSENRYTVEGEVDWMVRVTDVEAALRQRGYPRSADATVVIGVVDDLVERNHDTFTMRVRDGLADVVRGGVARVRADVRALAPLFTGYQRATVLARLGWIDGEREELEKLDALMAGPTPSMPDMF